MNEITYTALFLFCGLGGGALGFLQAVARLFGSIARIRSIGGIDIDEGACADFEYLTKSPALRGDIGRMQPAELRAFAGPRAPDIAFGSAPCKSFSGLTNPEIAASPEYEEMARLFVVGVELLLSTWDVPPRLIILENVPRILSKGKHLVDEVIAMLRSAGYVVHVSSHDCGELGGLAQHRRRALLVARYVRTVPALLDQPKKRRVRACGEVLGELPLPETPSAGIMHRMPRISWTTWVRLALIRAGGDHRDLPGVLGELEARRSKWARYHVEDFTAPSVAVTGAGTNGAYAIGDPRAPRWFRGSLGVVPWHEPTGVITGGGRPSKGAFSVADVRMARTPGRQPDHALGVLPWTSPTFTIHGQGTNPGSGAYAVADPRLRGVLSWHEAAKTINADGMIDGGPFAIVDKRDPGAPLAFIDHAKRSPFVLVEVPPKTARSKPKIRRVEVPVVILAEDGTWHRPLTPLELARLQDLPATVDGAPLQLHGENVGEWAERIGQAVPVGTARAIGDQMLLTLLSSDVGAGLAPSGGPVWVAPGFEAVGVSP